MKNTWKNLPVLLLAAVLVLSVQGCKKKKVNDLSDAQETTDATIGQSEGTDTDTSDASSLGVYEENLDGAAASSLSEISAEEASRILNNLSTIYFGYDQASLKAQDRSQLQRVASALRTLTGSTLSIQGHADERGSNEYNLALGDRRAYSIYEYLISLGVSPSQINAISFGEERPATRGMGEHSWSQNRRAEMVQQ